MEFTLTKVELSSLLDLPVTSVEKYKRNRLLGCEKEQFPRYVQAYTNAAKKR